MHIDFGAWDFKEFDFEWIEETKIPNLPSSTRSTAMTQCWSSFSFCWHSLCVIDLRDLDPKRQALLGHLLAIDQSCPQLHSIVTQALLHFSLL